MKPEVRAKLVKLEATALFTQVRQDLAEGRWWYFREAPAQGLSLRQQQSVSPYRCFLYLSYHFCGIPCDLYLEREVQVGSPTDDLWLLSFNIEGKEREMRLLDLLSPLSQLGFRISTGSENLDRQMNFSLGLYGAALMHVDVHFPTDSPPYPCFCRLMDRLEAQNEAQSPALALLAQEQQDWDALEDYGFDDGVIFGDWQTWK